MAKERVDRDDEDLVRLYLTDIGQYVLLTKDDEVRLAKEIEAGKEALEALEAGGKDLTTHKKRELAPHRPQGRRSRTPIRSVKPSSCRVDRKEVSGLRLAAS